MQGLSIKKQERVLALCEGNMTEKETDSELYEIFNHKKALTDKIEYDTVLLMKYESIGDEEMVNRGKAIISSLVAERSKLSHSRIARQLNMHERSVRYRYREFVGSKL